MTDSNTGRTEQPEPATKHRRMLSRDEYQSCPNCDTRWYANEKLPCPKCSAALPSAAEPDLHEAFVCAIGRIFAGAKREQAEEIVEGYIREFKEGKTWPK